MLTTAVFELVQQFYHATEIGSGVQRGANGAPAPGIQGQGGIQRVKLQKCKCCS